jgi:transposase
MTVPEAYYVGLDVPVKKTQVCILNQSLEIVAEAKIDTDPEDIALWLWDQKAEFVRVGLEAGPVSQWLYAGLAKAGLPVICVETRHAHDFMKSLQLNKNDRNDARGLARMMHSGIYKPVHVKTIESQRLRALLTARKVCQSKMIDIEISVRGILRNFGMKVGVTTKNDYEDRIRVLIVEDRLLQIAIEPLLTARQALRDQFTILHKAMQQVARKDAICQRLMTAPGVGPLVALTFKTSIDIPERFRSSKAVGAHIGLTPKQYQSGDTDVMGRISKCGDRDLRTALVESAYTILTVSRKNTPLRAWGIDLAKRRGMQKAAIAVARRMSAILHRMWVDGTDFRFPTEEPERIAA